MELQILHDLLFLVEDGNAVVGGEDLTDRFLLRFILFKNARPSNPYRLHDWVPPLQVKHVAIENALGGFDHELASLLVLLDNDRQFEGDYDQLLFRGLRLHQLLLHSRWRFVNRRRWLIWMRR